MKLGKRALKVESRLWFGSRFVEARPRTVELLAGFRR